ncbi:AsmA family protein [Shewanella sp.]|uniref:AsmA family protein n=1 Tax=Shewanella sp. TaxID=50422 RepID=UPI00356925D6
MKFIKWILVAIVLLVTLPVIYVTVIFDPNDFKPMLVDEVKKQTGRELEISEPLSWQLFPSIGIRLAGVSFSNPKGFSESRMMAVNEVVAEVKLLPLLSRDVQIDQLKIDGAKLTLITTKDGRTSFDGLSKGGDKATASTPSEAGSTAGLSAIAIGGVSITDTGITLIDEAAGSRQEFTLESLTLGEFIPGKATPLALSFRADTPDVKLGGDGKATLTVNEALNALDLAGFKLTIDAKGNSLPKGEVNVLFTGGVKADLAAQTASLTVDVLKVMDVEATGSIEANYGRKVPLVKAKLALGAIDVDALLGTDKAAKADSKASESAQSMQTEPDLTGMKAVDAALDLSIASVKVSGLSTADWKLKAKLNGGLLNVDELSAALYDGKISATASLDGRKKVASYSFNKTISGVQIQPLLKDAADMDLLAGTANFNIQGKGVGLVPERAKQNLNATGKFEVADGALYGVNVPQMIRGAQAKLKGDLSASDNAEQKTDFSSLTGSIAIANGKANNPDLLMLSPLLRISGNGGADLLAETLDYKLSTKVVGSLEGQGGDTALAGVDIPLAISGSFSEPKFALDTEALLKGQLKQETDKLKDKFKDSLFKKLGGN